MSAMTRTEQRTALSQAIQNAKEDFVLRLELLECLANEKRATFTAYVSAGFTEAQAMQLLCAAEAKK